MRTGPTGTRSSSCSRRRRRPRWRSGAARAASRATFGALGHDVTGLDASPTLVGAARDADPGGTYVVGDALALPFGDGAFDLVVAYNSLIDDCFVEVVALAAAHRPPTSN